MDPLQLYYDFALILSIVFLAIYIFMWHKHFDSHLTLIFVLIPVSNLGNVFLARAQTLEEAILANKLIYLGGSFLPLLIMLAIFGLCKINLNRVLRLSLINLGLISYASVLSIGFNDTFYITDSMKLGSIGDCTYIIKDYGFMHTVFGIFIIIDFVICVATLFYVYVKRNDISHRVVALLFMPGMFSVLAYFLGTILPKGVELVPLSYCFAMLVFLLIVYRINMYDITDSAIDSLVEKGSTGFVSFDKKFNYLGSNDTAIEMLPFLKDLKVDHSILDNEMGDTIIKWIDDYKADSKKDKVHYKFGDKIYLIDINDLINGSFRVGYQFFITDDTRDQKYMEMLKDFNQRLENRVKEKTAHIVEMHDNLILSMATMVESRDNSTGGHIKRTSVGVKILIEAMKAGGYKGLTDKFCNNIIKAAPMHDLGKIAVDDAILRFEGRYNDEQYAKMKTHAAEGARIVHEILKGTDDIDFHIMAENVAHYHHERWDGSGYPEGLKGEQIPLEARIMAIADVYDALVSKRCYKEKMPFDKADAIIMSGMGTQFDKSLEKYYVAARPELEKYYKSLEE